MVSSHESSEEDDERALHYERLPYDAQIVLDTEVGSCIAVHDKFILVGTLTGSIHILDHQGNKTKTLTSHETPVCHISVDAKGEYMASCSENGSVFVHGTASQDNNIAFSFEELVHFCCLNPRFATDSKRSFIIGTDKLMYYQKNFFNKYRMSVIFRGEGPIRTCSWQNRFAAFATDLSVIVFDMSMCAVLCKFRRDQDPSLAPELYPCHMAWMTDRQLLVGWADRINMCNIKEKMRRTHSSPTSFYLEISSIFTTDDIYVCGLAPCGSNIAILGTEKMDGRDNTSHMLFQLLEPHNKYCTQLSSDRIPLKMTSKLRTDFSLSCLTSEQRWFILSPSELVVARPADRDDHIDRLIGNEMYEEAMQVMVNCSSEIKRHSLLVVGKYYLNHLLDTEKYDQVGPLCQKIFGSQSALWEELIFNLATRKKCHIIVNYIPQRKDKKLNLQSYEIMLNEYIQILPAQLPAMVKRWKGLYDPRIVHGAIEERLKYAPDERLEEAVGLLLMYQERYAEALNIFISIRAAKWVHELLRDHFDILKDDIFKRILELMDIDYKEASNFFAKHDYYDVKEVSRRLNDRREYLLEYLRCKFARKPRALDEGDHGQLVEYFARHDPDSLLPFLRKSNKFPLERALHLCEEQGLVQETAFLYERMGNHRKALTLIVTELEDVEQAITFCKEQARDDLWQILIDLCVSRPQLLNVLLNHIGNYIDPTMLIRAIPKGLEIPDLRDSLVRIIHDFKLQIALRESCQKIILSNHRSLFERHFNLRRKPIHVPADSLCESCNRPIVQRDATRMMNVIAFACEHNYHDACVEKTDDLKCRICFNKTKSNFFEYYNA
ncbi:vacuolar protein sorting-associated protein 41 homolog [Galendromus occidentalis]|uniref:Vacuolar protein sorting-associated protein 41 homolog n=1 Tax=Galendromus occidentalis TaxID=34638 RepID=A0AAJ7WI97_9ACAR|nr:vacuolar protein sorting-associated protein 41 homolog [Galendromus occidentalis]